MQEDEGPLDAGAAPHENTTAFDNRPLAVVDIDGVVADVRHRLLHLQRRRKNWDAFFAAAPKDPPHAEGIELVHQLTRDSEVVFLTGRPSRCHADTQEWLARHGLGGHRLIMRPEGDRRPAAEVKVELLAGLAARRPVRVVVDDDARVLAAMRAAGHATRRAGWESRSTSGDIALAVAQEVDGRT